MSQTVQQHLQTYAIHYWLVVSTPLKNMSSSDWIIIPTIGEHIKFHGSSHHQPSKKKTLKFPSNPPLTMVFSPISHHINTPYIPYIWGDEDPLIIPGPSPRRFRRVFFSASQTQTSAGAATLCKSSRRSGTSNPRFNVVRWCIYSQWLIMVDG